jgi:cytochrome P450
MITAKRSTTQVMSEGGLDRPAEVDLISQLLKAQKLSESAKSDEEQGVSFDDSDVIGNLFMFIIAGHETSANSIHFAIVLLAMHPHIQKQVQEDLSTILDNRPVSEWTYERDLKALSNSLLAAVLNEQLRLIGPVIAIPKITNHLPQTLTVNGKVCILPAHTNVRLCASSVHFNPKVWPRSDPSTISMDTSTFSDQPADDLMEFKPSRWRSSHSSSSSDTEQIYNPPKGAFIAFSEGQRACLGKRFAQIEILAALAVILSQYSVELAVDNWASDEEVAKMSTEEQARVWKKAEDNARSLLRDKVSSILTLQLRGAHIPVRFVKKGEERSR